MARRSSLKNSGLNRLFRATGGEEEKKEEAGSPGSSPKERKAPESGDSKTHPGRRRLIPQSHTFPAVIRVVGVGGAGVNAVNRMLEAGLEGVEFIAVNTDVQALQMCEADHKLRIGRELTGGLGGGSDPRVGEESAFAARDEIKALLKGSDMIFVTAGEGGGTGTGAAPVIARIGRDVGALTIGVVSRPFTFEGKRRREQAEKGVQALRDTADTVIVVPNDKLLEVVERGTSMVEALRLADDVLRQGVQGVCDLVTVPGLINLDLADVRTIMEGAGTSHMGIGLGNGEQRAQKAAEMAVNSSLLETSIEGARGILLNVSGGSDLSLFEVNEVAEYVNEAADPEANIIFGAVVDESLASTVRVTVVATGFEGAVKKPEEAEEPARTVSPQAEPRGEAEDEERRLPANADSLIAQAGSEEDRGSEAGDEELDVPTFLRRVEEREEPETE